MQNMHATYRDLPAEAFSSVGTYVNTIAMQVWKDGRAQRWNGGRKF
jgi:hypothetical protein